jgi:hypothetical protein
MFSHLRSISEKAIERQPTRWLSKSTLCHTSERLLTTRNDESAT